MTGTPWNARVFRAMSPFIVSRFPFFLITLVLLAIALSGCNRALDRADLVFVNGAESELLDPALCTAQATGRIMDAIYEGLTAFDQTGAPQPGVAERWDISPDGRV